MSEEDEGVHRDVDDEGDGSEHELIGARQAFGVERPEDVPLDEISLILLLPALATQRIFERREWTNRAAELHEGAPEYGRNVQPRDPGPAQSQGAAQHDEHYK